MYVEFLPKSSNVYEVFVHDELRRSRASHGIGQLRLTINRVVCCGPPFWPVNTMSTSLETQCVQLEFPKSPQRIFLLFSLT